MKHVEEYDAIVVGSGAAGGWAAKELAERGVRTILLEAGPHLDPERDFPPPAPGKRSKLQLMSRARATLGGQHIQGRCMSYSPLTRHLFVSDSENPYEAAPGAPFNWFRARQVGGRLHLWGRNALRIGDEQFHAARVDGYGAEWPISYADLAPWYDRVEQFLGVDGSPAGVASIPDGIYEHPLRLTAAEQQLMSALHRAWPDRPVTTARIVRHNPRRTPLPILAGLETGRLTVRSDAVVSRVTLEPSGRARGVVFVDRVTREEHEVRARVLLDREQVEAVPVREGQIDENDVGALLAYPGARLAERCGSGDVKTLPGDQWREGAAEVAVVVDHKSLESVRARLYLRQIHLGLDGGVVRRHEERQRIHAARAP